MTTKEERGLVTKSVCAAQRKIEFGNTTKDMHQEFLCKHCAILLPLTLMVFSSPIFLFYFLPVILLIYAFARGHINLQNIILFFGSLLFYFWGEKQYAILVLFSITINYGFGYFISTLKSIQYQKLILAIGIICNLSLLLYYKYFDFIVSVLLHEPNRHSVHLPLGVSFFTFHGLTYIIDIYRKDAIAAKSPLNVGLYILFFPQLIAGPIVRYKDIDKQLNYRIHSTEKMYEGIRRFIIGFAKKICIANSLGSVADLIYNLPNNEVSTSISWLAIVCYTLQIYFDFSGYSDMAIGLAKIFGFEFVENFNFPYTARSIQDFWRRWHISLSTFFRDYVYFPLGGNRKGLYRTYFNLLLVFFLTGLWHGASWGFIAWGLFHGAFLVIERLGWSSVLDKLPKWFGHVYTIFVVMIGWVLFRVEGLRHAFQMLKRMFLLSKPDRDIYSVAYFMSTETIVMLLLGIILSYPIHRKSPSFLLLKNRSASLKLVIDCFYIFLFLYSLVILSASTYNPFIYFRF